VHCRNNARSSASIGSPNNAAWNTRHARHDWLRGRHSSTSIVRVGTVTQENGRLTVIGTVIAIANGFGQLKTRDYLPRGPVKRPPRKKIIQI
jgi:hypothetical protein